MMTLSRAFVVVLLLLLSLAAHTQDAQPKIIAHIAVRGALPESSRSMEISLTDLMQPNQMMRQRDTHYSVVTRLHKAERDPNVEAVWLDFSNASIGLGQMGELRRCMNAIRAKGKKIWIHEDSLGLGSLYLASAADRISVTPEGDVVLPGLCVEQLFFKGVLDKLKIKTQWVHTGDFKTYGESFYRSNPSSASMKQTSQLLNAFYATLDEGITESRSLPKGKLRKLVDQGILTPAQAVEEKLIDATEYRHEFRTKMRDAFKGCRIETNYAQKRADKLEINGLLDLVQFIGKLSTPKPKTFYKRIKLIVLEGSISQQSCEHIRKALYAAARDPRVRAVVLRINSPGGSALMSDILATTCKVIKKRKKPFIVSMGDAAASGGYYIAAPADRIFAEEATMTGSIGVVAGRFVFQDALTEIGINVHTQTVGKHAAMNAMFTPWTQGDVKVLTDMITRTYARFQAVVTEGRGNRIKVKLEKLAGGRVYTGSQALKHGLVDEIGGVWEAVEYARKQAKLPADTAVEVYPKEQSLLEILMAPEQQASVNRDRPALPKSLLDACRLLQQKDPRKANQLFQYLSAFQLLSKGKVLAIAPVYLY